MEIQEHDVWKVVADVDKKGIHLSKARGRGLVPGTRSLMWYMVYLVWYIVYLTWYMGRVLGTAS